MNVEFRMMKYRTWIEGFIKEQDRMMNDERRMMKYRISIIIHHLTHRLATKAKGSMRILVTKEKERLMASPSKRNGSSTSHMRG